jgi:hypothetical protein
VATEKQTAAEYIEANAMLVPFILGDMAEQLGKAAQEWSHAVWSMQKGELDKALTHVVECGIAADITIRVGRSEVRAITERAGKLLDAELPDEDEG